MKITHLNANKVLFNNIYLCNTFIKKLRGLMFFKSWPQKYDCFLFYSCNMIHSFFVKFPFDAVFLNKDKKILYLKSYKINELGPYVKNGYYILETPLGTIDKLGIKINDNLSF